MINEKCLNLLKDFATKEKIDYHCLISVALTESSGGGFIPNIKEVIPVILFERHIFWRRLVVHGIDPLTIIKNSDRDILGTTPYKHQYGANKDHIKNNPDVYYVYGINEWDKRLNKAYDLCKGTPNEEKCQLAALESASYGQFQIMGFNYRICGYPNVRYLYSDNFSEDGQYNCFFKFLKGNNLLNLIRTYNWLEFALKYNGPSAKQNKYDTMLQDNYNLSKKTYS